MFPVQKHTFKDLEWKNLIEKEKDFSGDEKKITSSSDYIVQQSSSE